MIETEFSKSFIVSKNDGTEVDYNVKFSPKDINEMNIFVLSSEGYNQTWEAKKDDEGNLIITNGGHLIHPTTALGQILYPYVSKLF